MPMALVEFAPHAMTGNSSPVPYVATAGSTYGTQYPYKAFDGSVAGFSYWLGQSGQTNWLKIYLGPTMYRSLYSYTLQVNTIPEPTRAPKNWTIQGSVDDTNWTVLDTRTNQTSWTSGEARNFICLTSGGTAFCYFRLNVTANNGDATYLQVGEWYMYTRTITRYLHDRRQRIDMRGVSVAR